MSENVFDQERQRLREQGYEAAKEILKEGKAKPGHGPAWKTPGLRQVSLLYSLCPARNLDGDRPKCRLNT